MGTCTKVPGYSEGKYHLCMKAVYFVYLSIQCGQLMPNIALPHKKCIRQLQVSSGVPESRHAECHVEVEL